MVAPEPPKAKAAPAPKAAPKAAAKPAAKAAAKKPARAAAKPVKVKAVASKRIAKAAVKPVRKAAAAKPAAKKPAAKAKAAPKPAAKAKGKSSKGEVVEVDKILAMRSSSKGVEYHILWMGGGKKGGEKSWEPEDNVMDDDLVDDFEAALQEKIYGGQSFAAGEKVEVRNVDDGFDNSWTGGTVQKSKGSKFTVEYSAFVDDKGKKMTDNVDRSRLRPRARGRRRWARSSRSTTPIAGGRRACRASRARASRPCSASPTRSRTSASAPRCDHARGSRWRRPLSKVNGNACLGAVEITPRKCLGYPAARTSPSRAVRV